MDWNEVTNVEELHEYIEEHIGWENVYDEMYQDMIFGMSHNRESKKKFAARLKQDESDSILIHP